MKSRMEYLSFVQRWTSCDCDMLYGQNIWQACCSSSYSHQPNHTEPNQTERYGSRTDSP